MSEIMRALKTVLSDPVLFSSSACGLELRSYQIDVLRAIVDSIREGLGLSFVVIFPRQSGKNELQALLETYLLQLLSGRDAEIVKVSPTWKPQSLNAMRRLERRLISNILLNGAWKKEQGYIYRVGRARVYFFTGSPGSNIVGATASTLLSVDEAQEILPDKYDKDLAPMAASTNATRVFWGTAWTSQTLLARELRYARQAESEDGRRRAFVLDADVVGNEVESYRRFVVDQVRRLGRNHPLVVTQYYSQEIDAQSNMITSERMAAMMGRHESEVAPASGSLYVFLVDVAGEDEGVTEGILRQPGRDSSALVIVRVVYDEIDGVMVYEVCHIREWIGVSQTKLYADIKTMADVWLPAKIIVDATGIGEGLASFLTRRYGDIVVNPLKVTSAVKSRLGYGLIALAETGRLKLYKTMDKMLVKARKQLENLQSLVRPGPGSIMAWSVPDGTRDNDSGELIHDDIAFALGLSTIIDELEIGAGLSAVSQAVDILGDMRGVF